jgi:hypothetical protein
MLGLHAPIETLLENLQGVDHASSVADAFGKQRGSCPSTWWLQLGGLHDHFSSDVVRLVSSGDGRLMVLSEHSIVSYCIQDWTQLQRQSMTMSRV